MAGTHYCEKCGRSMAKKEFYVSKNLERYPDGGLLNQCKRCITMHVDNWEPDTYLWILEEADVPYVKEVWDTILAKNMDRRLTGMSVLGRYLSTMKLKQWKEFRWADGPRIAEITRQEKQRQMLAQGFTPEQIEEQLNADHTPRKPGDDPAVIAAVQEQSRPRDNTSESNEPPQDPGPMPIVDDAFIAPTPEETTLTSQLTADDKAMLRNKWGGGYTPSEWIRMETLYDEMTRSYDIQTAAHKDTLILICKASLMTNKLLDCGDIDSAQKMSRVYDNLMKSGKFTAAQNKEESGEAVDTVGELVAMCEKDGFIPRYYVETPNDHIDRVIQDMQKYVYDLVTEELGLENLIINSKKAIEQEQASIAAAAEIGDVKNLEALQEEELFDYDKNILQDEDFQEFNRFLDSQEEEDREEDDT